MVFPLYILSYNPEGLGSIISLSKKRTGLRAVGIDCQWCIDGEGGNAGNGGVTYP